MRILCYYCDYVWDYRGNILKTEKTMCPKCKSSISLRKALWLLARREFVPK